MRELVNKVFRNEDAWDEIGNMSLFVFLYGVGIITVYASVIVGVVLVIIKAINE